MYAFCKTHAVRLVNVLKTPCASAMEMLIAFFGGQHMRPLCTMSCTKKRRMSIVSLK